MSLIAWYPLNGDTKDYSGNGYDGIPTGVVSDNNGKIGKTYIFDGTISDYITLPTDIITNVYDFTLCLWFNSSNITKPINTPFHGTIGGGNDLTMYIRSAGTSSFAILGVEVSYNFVFSSNVWYHLVYKRKGSNCNLYVNGVSQGWKSCGSGVINIPPTGYILLGQEQDAIGGGFDATQAMEGKLNDVRFYNNAISDKEIIELSKAKILHYTFNDFQEPTTNLVVNPKLTNLTSWVVARYPSGTYGVNDGVVWDIDVATVTHMSGYTNTQTFCLQYITLVSGTTYTASVMCYTHNNFAVLDIYTGSAWSTSYCTTYDAWTKLSVTFVAGGTGGQLRFGIYSSSDRIAYFRDYQLEEKDHDTPFTIDSRNAVIRDNSGYGNDATLSGPMSAKFGVNSGVTIDGNNVTKLLTSSAWDAGTISNQLFYDDCFLEYNIDYHGQSSGAEMVGFNSNQSTWSFGDIDFAIYTNGNDGRVRIYENGTNKLDNAGVWTGLLSDTFRIEIISGVVKYYMNSILIYTSLTTATFPQYIDMSLHCFGLHNTISNVKVGYLPTSQKSPSYVDSKLGNGAYEFKGIQKYIDTNTQFFSTTNSNNEFTLSAWINPSNNLSEQWVIDQYNYGTYRFIWMRNTSGIMDYFYNGNHYYGSTVSPLNTWSHFGLTRDISGNLKFYLNGIIDGTGNSTGVTQDINTHIGSFYLTYNTNYKLDDVRIYATVLSNVDILQLYQSRIQLDNIGNLYSNEIIYDFPKSAYDIQQRYPNAKSGIYTIQPNLNLDPILAYCDMDTDGGGWTLLVCSQSQLAGQWDSSTILSKNQSSPSIVSDYSILSYGDSIKSDVGGGKLQYRIDAVSFGRWGGVWEAPFTNTFTAYDMSNPFATNLRQYDSWTIDTSLSSNSSLSNRMPWLQPSLDTILSTWDNAGSWWGTLVTNNIGYDPAPYITPQMPNPGIIWYWVK